MQIEELLYAGISKMALTRFPEFPSHGRDCLIPLEEAGSVQNLLQCAKAGDSQLNRSNFWDAPKVG
jgi:hypothetical protein